ncbi:MAG: Obg family GTPase CgtA, partial [Candidatus Kryptoniota bacterium]
GTIIKDANSGRVLADLVQHGDKFLAARGGKGGRGNAEFATPTDRAPRHAEEGKPGEERLLKLELKLIADVGLVGFPNAGKSTLLSVISAAHPRIADYPFTTLFPVLGIVKRHERSFVVADMPGLIEGASQGKGLGFSFLKHIERTKLIAILIDSTSQNILSDIKTLRNELKSYSSKLPGKIKVIVLTKIDLLSDEDRNAILRIKFPPKTRVHPVSAVTHEGIDELLSTFEGFIFTDSSVDKRQTNLN